MHIIIDGDPMVYRAGFAAEIHGYDVVYEDEDGELLQQYFVALPANGKDRKEPITAGTRMKEFLKENPHLTVVSKEKVVEPLPVTHALQVIKTAITSCLTAVKDKYKVEDPEVTLLLTGEGNFREGLATIKPYKGNREDMVRPVHYQAIRDYMIESWDAVVIHGREADDECSILSTRDYNDGKLSIICTIDKDLDMVVGLHYDYMKHVFYETERQEGLQLFYAQMLSGDATDNIQGLYRCGTGKASTMVEQYVEEWSDAPEHWRGELEEYLWEKALAAYEENIEKYPQKYPEGMTAEQAALETARLVYMQQLDGELWNPPDRPNEFMDYEMESLR